MSVEEAIFRMKQSGEAYELVAVRNEAIAQGDTVNADRMYELAMNIFNAVKRGDPPFHPSQPTE